MRRFYRTNQKKKQIIVKSTPFPVCFSFILIISRLLLIHRRYSVQSTSFISLFHPLLYFVADIFFYFFTYFIFYSRNVIKNLSRSIFTCELINLWIVDIHLCCTVSSTESVILYIHVCSSIFVNKYFLI